MRAPMEFDEAVLEQRVVAGTGGDAAVGRAIAVARRVHAGAFRDEGTPYVCHPLRVALILIEEIGVRDSRLVCAAVLHDALEDGRDVTYEDLAAEFGPCVAGLVGCLTDEYKSSGLPRAERKALYLRRVARADADCLMVKICDRLDNLRSLPYSRDAEKQELMRQETRAYLMPAIAGRAGVFPVLERLLGEALEGG